MSFMQLDEGSRQVLQHRLERMKEEQHDMNIDIKAINFDLNENIDLQVKRKKRDLTSRQADLYQQIRSNALSIVEIERTLYRGGYDVQDDVQELSEVKEETKEDDLNGGKFGN